MILQKLKKNASNFLGTEVKDAVIAVPNYFNEDQLDEIRNTAEISGLNILRFIKSSTGALLAYGFDRIKYERNILIFDLGGAILNIGLGTYEDGLLEERSVYSSFYLGGEDFNYRLFDYCVKEFQRKTGIDIKKNDKAKSRLFNSCENAKKDLSFSTSTSIDLESLIDGKDFNITITRNKFEDLFKIYLINVFLQLRWL